MELLLVLWAGPLRHEGKALGLYLLRVSLIAPSPSLWAERRGKHGRGLIAT